MTWPIAGRSKFPAAVQAQSDDTFQSVEEKIASDARLRAISVAWKKWLSSIFYGRYNELVDGCYFMVYKPTYDWGTPSCIGFIV